MTDCEHHVITHDNMGFFCETCGAAVTLKSKTGKTITPADIDRWVTEAEQGYDINPKKGKAND
jgi:hypothetical protein